MRNNLKNLRDILGEVWPQEDLLSHAMKTAEILADTYGREFNFGYLTGLALFLYWQDTEIMSDEELDRYIKDIMSLSKRNKFKQIYARG